MLPNNSSVNVYYSYVYSSPHFPTKLDIAFFLINGIISHPPTAFFQET